MIMIRQGLSVTIIPNDKDDNMFYVYVNSSAWDGSHCIASRQVTMAKVEMPLGVSAQPENGLWMTDFLEVAAQILARELNPPRPSTVSDANGHVSGG